MKVVFRTLALALLLAATATHADSAKPEPISPAKPTPIQAYGAQNAACFEWTDGCVICTREGCSTSGIACQPGGVVCKKLKK